MGESDIADLADKLFRAKRRVYRRSLLEEAGKLGYRDVKRPRLSQEITNALQAESREHAERIAQSFNDDLRAQGDTLADKKDDEIRPALRTWAIARQRKRARPTAITEAYTAHADATLSLFLDLGVPMDTAFDFGGHPELGDSHPVCDICIALVRGNPWTLADVVRIGNPHIACRQRWHQHGVDQRILPPELPDLGETLAGIIGRDNLLSRHRNNRDAAVAEIQRIAEEGE